MKAPFAGNTSQNLQGTDRDIVAQAAIALPSAADLDAVASEQAIKEATGPATIGPAPLEGEELANEIEFEAATAAFIQAELDREDPSSPNVLRTEFEQLRAEFNTLVAKIDRFNQRSGHQI